MSENTIGQAYIEIVPTTDGFSGKLSQALGGESGAAGALAGNAFSDAFGKAAGVTSAVTKAVAGATATFVENAIDVSQSFDSAMSQVAATMGYTSDEINTAGTEAYESFNKLSDFAQEMGASTAFSATEAAEALNYMALAGYDVDTSIEMLPNVLNLAAAGNINLAQASDMVTDAQSALNLSLDETNDMVNMMAVTSSKSNTSVQQLGDALLTIGATGRDAAGGTKELATMLGVMADNGIKGTEGGTHLRNIMLSLAQHSDKIKKALDIDVYDENGSLRDMTQIFTEMGDAMESMTDAEKTEFLTHEMFNKTDLAAVNALLGTEIERYDELSKAIGDAAGSTAASDMAQTQLDNLAGDIKLYESALEGFRIAAAGALTPIAREFVQFGSDALSGLTEKLKDSGVQEQMKQVGEAIGESLDELIKVLPDLMDVAIELIKMLPDLIRMLIPILDMVITKIAEMAAAFNAMSPEEQEKIIQGIAGAIAGFAALGTIVPVILNVAAGIANVATMISGLISAAPAIEGIVTAITGIGTAISGAVMPALTAIGAVLTGPVLAAIGLVAAAVAVWVKNWEYIKEIPEGIAFMFEYWMKNLHDFIVAKGKELLLGIANMILKISTMYTELKNKAKQWGTDMIQGLIDGIKSKFEAVRTTIKSVAELIASYVHFSEPDVGPLSNFHTFMPDMMQSMAAGIDQNAKFPVTSIRNVSGEMATAIQGEMSTDAANSTASGNYEIASTDNSNLYDLMAQYLPEIAEGKNTTVKLEGDAAGIFNLVKNQNNMAKRMSGRSVLA